MNQNKQYLPAFIMMTSLFFMWGFITCMNDILIPYLKSVFHLSHFKAMFVQFAFFGSYFVGSIIYFIVSAIGGDPINRIGYKNGVIIGLLISGTGSALFYPAAQYAAFGFFLSAIFILGLGFTLLQISANPYVAILGSEKSASGRINLSQAFNSLGTTIAPIIGGYLVFHYFLNDALGGGSVKIPYLIFAAVFLMLAVFFFLAPLPSFINKTPMKHGLQIFRHRQVNLGMLAIFMYVGAEVSVGSILISFLKLPEIAGFDENMASTFVAFYWGGLMIGRFAGGIMLNSFRKQATKWILISIATIAALIVIFGAAYLKSNIDIQLVWYYLIFIAIGMLGFYFGKGLPATTMFMFTLCIIALLITCLFSSGAWAMWAVIGIGLFNSIMWGNIFAISIRGMGQLTAQTSSLLVMMIVGGAIIPLFQGFIADVAGVHQSFVVPLFAYAYLIYFAWINIKKDKK